MATNKVKHACHEAANVLRVMKLTLLLWHLLRRYIEGCCLSFLWCSLLLATPSLSQWLLTNQRTSDRFLNDCILMGPWTHLCATSYWTVFQARVFLESILQMEFFSEWYRIDSSSTQSTRVGKTSRVSAAIQNNHRTWFWRGAKQNRAQVLGDVFHSLMQGLPAVPALLASRCSSAATFGCVVNFGMKRCVKGRFGTMSVLSSNTVYYRSWFFECVYILYIQTQMCFHIPIYVYIMYSH